MRRLILSLTSGEEPLSDIELNKAIRESFDSFENLFGKPALPSPGETVAVAWNTPKTASLFFDRVWSVPIIENSAPDPIRVYGGTDVEFWPGVVVLAFQEKPHLINPIVGKYVTGDLTTLERKLGADLYAHSARTISAALFEAHGINSIPMYRSSESRNLEYKSGNSETMIAAIDGAQVVDESRLAWEQVIEFRKDTEARLKLRRMRLWLDSNFADKPIAFVSDSIATKLEDYEWALKKHGMSTVVGTFSELVDTKLLTSAAVATAGLAAGGAGLWAALGGVGIIAGKAVASVTKKMIDLGDIRRGPNSEIAFVHELRKLSG